MKNIEDVRKLPDDFMKQLEKQIGKKLPFAAVPEDMAGFLEQTKKKREAAIIAKEAGIKRWDEEIHRHDRMIARLNKQFEAEKKAAKEAEKARKEAAKEAKKEEASANRKKVARKTTAGKKADTTKATSKTKEKKS